MGKKLTIEDFVTRSREIHKGKYSYEKVEYKNNSTKVEIVCPEHGSFFQNPNSHLLGSGCPKCVPKRVYTSIWNYERCKLVSNKCRNRKELKKLCGGAYKRCVKNGWLDEFFPKKK